LKDLYDVLLDSFVKLNLADKILLFS